MVGVPRIELGLTGYKPVALPLSYTPLWSAELDLNQRLTPYQSATLPLSYLPRYNIYMDTNTQTQKPITNTKKGYGWRPDLPDQRDFMYQVSGPVSVPASVDLRSKMPPIVDQGNLGSCTACAIAGSLDYDRLRQGEVAEIPSRLFVYYNERLIESDVEYDAGATIRDTVKSVVRYGACPESEWGYDITKFADKPTQQCYTDAVKYEALQYRRLPLSSIAMKQCLANGNPFIFGFSVYDSFESGETARTGIVTIPQPSEALLGGHAVLCVGYLLINKQPYWICRNSWGTDWGDKGYFYMPQGYLLERNYASDFWTVTTVK